ncbi:hypothetical protein HOD20_03980 [archaeon]|nr:hypothetical protein [Candidatus Woesearchaeota archaeon]MBT3464714.1 hypothetical protein [archaeon]MBT4351662.1 hypothetical protein [archaeon]MBT4647561.1 hypothetical protein [archaeon]MBT6821943.1 hypothetical protein [archaeon]
MKFDKFIKKNEKVLLLIILFVVFIKIYSFHFNYAFPYHHDEWQHIAISDQIIELGYNAPKNPYIVEFVHHKDLEHGFHFFLSNLKLLTNLDLVLSYKLFPAFFGMLTSFFLFIMVKYITKDVFASLLSTLLYGSLKSNVNILGIDYFIPLTLASIFFFFNIYVFIKFLEEEGINNFILMLISFLTTFLIHPPSLVILIFPFLIYGVIKYKKVIKLNKLYFIFLFLFFLLFFIFSVIFIELNIKYKFLEELLSMFYFGKNWTYVNQTYSIILLYGFIATIIGLYGAYISFKKEEVIFLLILFISLFITSIFNNFNFSILVPYQRAVHYATFALLPLTSIGIVAMFKKFKLKKYDYFKVAFLVFLIFLIFSSKYDINDSKRYYKEPSIDLNSYKALLWVNDNIEKNKVFMSPFLMTSAIYPITGNKVVSVAPAQLLGGNYRFNVEFYDSDCNYKKTILNNVSANYVLSNFPFECNFLNIKYRDNYYIYEFQNK